MKQSELPGNHHYNRQQRDRRIQSLSDDLDVARHEMDQLPVGSHEWLTQRKRVVALDERLHQLRTEGIVKT